ncbi:helix-turn-helix domain-containing protein [Paraeggerthella hongkongensis]|uniref:helix-turn-helix domain-containing protein n=1 Tax=Paraeggerthella TaxID=651554 RepID=UPI000DF797C2|nr:MULTISPECIES: helix-turn-helix transcriptional regulator [Paraeggerthella]MBU5405561.1 helix-turn-helix domain-containing protein [Paraeggerthella hongkongensis]MCD2432619.1 helix-turn-helix domain-containing protein [Paraeggerthella hominis]RDB58818.1 XRE family transcriptional regulator [Paraeggerthella hongkongensis]
MTVATRKIVGQRIKELREQAGLNQTEAAGRLGMERSYYAKIERGERNCTLDAYERIAAGFGLSLGEFFEGL